MPSSRLRRLVGRLRRYPGIAWVTLGTLVLRVVYGPGYVHYDALYSLIWGRDLVHGRLPPDFADSHSPTEHPLANVLAGPISLAHLGGLRTLDWISLVMLATLAWMAVRLGRALFTLPIGLGFAALLLTCPPIVEQMLMASIDVPFLVLILWAAVLEAERPRRGLPIVAVLAVCGLLRPEAWLLGAAYVLYLSPRRDWSGRLRLGGLVLVAPVLWALFDLASAHDAAISLTGTQRAGHQTQAQHSLGAAIVHGPQTLASILGTGISVLGIAGAGLALAVRRRRSALALVLLGLGLLGFLGLGAVGLPVIPRYAFVPALMVALFCSYAVFGWAEAPPGSTVRRVWMIGAPLLLVALVVTNARYYTHRLPQLRRAATTLSADDGRLDALLATPAVRPLIQGCRPLQLRDFRAKPLAAYLIGGHARDYVQLLPQQVAGSGSYLEHIPVHGEPALPPGFRTVGRTRHWTLSVSCPPLGAAPSGL